MKPFLSFTLNGLTYVVDAKMVREIVWLPEITPVEEAPGYISGVVNIRGRVVPVMNLNICFGNHSPGFSLMDSVIVLESEDRLIGIIVNEINDMLTISGNEIELAPAYDEDGSYRSGLVSSVAKVEEGLIMILDHEKALTLSFRTPQAQNEEQKDESEQRRAIIRNFYPEATEEEMAIFAARAGRLKKPVDLKDFSSLHALAVVSLNNEFFGVELEAIREFCKVRELTPVPCCPGHIVGNMNLRGEVLTIVDIRKVLKIVESGASAVSYILVYENDELVAGVVFDEILDVIFISPSNISSVPLAVKSMNEEYIKSTTPYNEIMLGILDIPKIIKEGNIVVYEEV